MFRVLALYRYSHIYCIFNRGFVLSIEGLRFRIRRMFRRILRALRRARKVLRRILRVFGLSLGRGPKVNLPIYISTNFKYFWIF